jgi:hypothetical protein
LERILAGFAPVWVAVSASITLESERKAARETKIARIFFLVSDGSPIPAIRLFHSDGYRPAMIGRNIGDKCLRTKYLPGASIVAGTCNG